VGRLPGGEDTETTYSVIFLEVRIQKLRTRSSIPGGEDTETTYSVICLEVGYNPSSTCRRGYRNNVLGHLPGGEDTIGHRPVGEDTETTYSVVFLEVRIQKLHTQSSSWR
jgi:hypothetical protein